MTMREDLSKILITEEEIDKITSSIAARITEDYKNATKPIMMVIILKGSINFASDLMRKIPLPMSIEFMKVSSYGAGTKQSGEIKVQLDLKYDNLEDYEIIVVEDIVDSGRTLLRLTQLLRARCAQSVRTVTLLDKPSRREVEFTPDYCGRIIPDEFVVGYGLDYAEKYRNLPYIGILDPKIYS